MKPPAVQGARHRTAECPAAGGSIRACRTNNICREIPLNARFICIAALAAAVSGCAIRQNVKPVEALEVKQVCIVESTGVKPGFLEAYKRTLSNKGYQIRQLPATASLLDCPVTSTYTATWRWDLALYMDFAEIVVYEGGKQIGKATYSARGGAGNMNKFIDADKKVGELVNQLFPGGAGS
jgi:hypothetical protein